LRFIILFLNFLAASVKPCHAIAPPPVLINVGVSVLEVLGVVFSLFYSFFLSYSVGKADKLKNNIEVYRGREIYLIGNCGVLSRQMAKELVEDGFDAHYISRGIRWFAYYGCGFFLYNQEGDYITMLPRFYLKSQRKKWGLPPVTLSRIDYTRIVRRIFYSKNSHKLWKTQEVKDKLVKNKVPLVDVRPKKNLHDYIISIPVGSMSVEEVDKKIDSIPRDKGIKG